MLPTFWKDTLTLSSGNGHVPTFRWGQKFLPNLGHSPHLSCCRTSYIAWNYNFDFDLRHLCVSLLNYLRSELFQMHSSQAATSLDTLLQHHDHFLYITFYPISLLRLMSSFRRPIGGYLCLLAAVVPSPSEVKWLLPGRSVGAIVAAASVRKGTVWSTRGATFSYQTALNNWLTGRLIELTQHPTIYWLTSGLMTLRKRVPFEKLIVAHLLKLTIFYGM